MKKILGFGALGVLAVLLAGPAQAEIKVGFITSLSGPGASIGIPYSKGMKAALAYMSEVSGEKIRVIELDDASDTPALRGRTGLVIPDREALLQRLDKMKKPLEGTRFAFKEHGDHVETTCPWGNKLLIHEAGSFGRMQLGMPYVEFDVPAGSAKAASVALKAEASRTLW